MTLAVLGFDWAVPVYGDKLSVGMMARGNFSLDALARDGKKELSSCDYVC